MNKVSFIVPMYKAKSYIKPCVAALFRQGLEDFEILLIDDKSPDDTYEYARDLYKDNPCVRVIEAEQNGGPAKARNRGLMEADGKYICFADVDDMYVDGAISKMLNIAITEEADVVHANGMYLTVVKPVPDDLSTLSEDDFAALVFTSGARDIYDAAPYLRTEIKDRLAAFYSQECHWNVWGKLYKKEFLDKNDIRFLDMKLGEDCGFILMCLLNECKYVQTNDFSYIYRIGDGESASRGKRVFVNALKSIFEAEKSLNGEFEKIPFVRENPEELIKLKNKIIADIEGPYAVVRYRQENREELKANPDVIAVFKEYYGDLAEDKMREVFDKYDKYPEVMSAESFLGYDLWKAIKDKIGNDRVSLGGVKKLFE